MVERMDDVPAGVIGLRASGKLTKEDYTDVLEPALKEAMDSGEARVLFVLTDFEHLQLDATFEDIKTGLGVEFAHRKDWKRLAMVTDVDWVASWVNGVVDSVADLIPEVEAAVERQGVSER